MLTTPPRRAALIAAAAAAVSVLLTGVAGPAQAAPAIARSPAPEPTSAFSFTDPPPAGVAAAGTLSTSAKTTSVPKSLDTSGSGQALPRQLFVPDIIAAVPTGLTPAQLTKIKKLSGVRAVLAVSGGEITVNGHSADVIGVPEAFRSWTPPATAAADSVWTDFGKGQLISTGAAASQFHLAAGHSYPVSAAVSTDVPFGAKTTLSVPGVSAVVDQARSAQLGLIKNVAVLINAPGANLGTLKSQIQSVVGISGKVVNLVSYAEESVSKLPVDTDVSAGAVPHSLLELYQDSAKDYCPGMSWTVLAAINEIESGDGTNDGPSSAGAEGPMQFLPSTWAEWGIDGFGPTGTPDIDNPLDAVPSAARMLCADGGGNSSTLSSAIYSYNHATWYVDEVLALASEYAKDYS